MSDKPIDLYYIWLMQRQCPTPRDLLDSVGIRVLYVAPEYRTTKITPTLWTEPRERAQA